MANWKKYMVHRWTENEVAILSDLYPNTENSKIAEILKLSKEQIIHKAKALKLHKIKKKKPKKISTRLKDVSGFYNILEKGFTPELAYFLGYFWADGHCNNASLVMEITEKDGLNIKPVLMKLYNFKISRRERVGRKPQMSFYILDKKFSNLLKSLGKYPRTSESHKKVLTFIPEEFHRFFFLGLSDGDGSFYSNGFSTQFAISSNFAQDWSGLIELLKDFSVHISTEIQGKNRSSMFRITNLMQIKKLIHWMYDGHDLGLSRKRNKAMEILNK